MSAFASLRETLAPWMRRAAAWRQRAVAWYEQRPPREQRLLAVAGALLAAAFVFLILIEPAWSTMTRARQELPGLRAQAATVADLTAQVRILRRQGAGTAAGAAPSATELAASLRREGLPDDSWSLSEAATSSGAQKTASSPAPATTLTLREASSAALFRWLDTAARDWRLSVSGADLARATHPTGRRLPGRMNGTLTLLPATQP
ncbi:type II secretion system protein GspM [Bordetella sp. BOR01]|uniref:type II secretion system protein GspM n=1 Tax=Bordetella sp. BOR01 TaxID=2854779 RepID=UPI001C48FDC8|nr:type II secretion system protein GspM [Bordetella sp. BOR01]MBV7482796.1 type II secretion system protein M [Bordetella sp. BOR01]